MQSIYGPPFMPFVDFSLKLLYIRTLVRPLRVAYVPLSGAQAKEAPLRKVLFLHARAV